MTTIDPDEEPVPTGEEAEPLDEDAKPEGIDEPGSDADMTPEARARVERGDEEEGDSTEDEPEEP